MKKLMISIALGTALSGVLAISTPGFAAVNEVVRFKRGESSAAIEGAVIRGERDRYVIEARKGQRMTVAITSLEDNAVFDIHSPGFKEGADGDITGKTLPSGTEARHFEVALPASGRYLVVVGGTRGNATYKLTISIAANK